MNLLRFVFNIRVIVLSFLLVAGFACAKQSALTVRSTTEPEKIVERRVTFLAVGDMMISRGVANVIARTGSPLTPFRKMENILNSTDFNFGNLEVPISGRNDVFGKELKFNMNTRHVVGLKTYNFRILNLANNHALDQKIKGLQNTQKVLNENNLTFLGVGNNLEQAWQPKMIVVKDLKIGFVGASYASFNDGGAERNNYVARIEDLERLKTAIEKLKADGADFVVATMHAGVEYTRQPHQPQITFARAAVDFGADIVIGAHPHWIQTFEQYRGRYIFYSLGNFIFDQEWSRDTKEGLALRIGIINRKSLSASDTSVEQIELIPVVIENHSTPRPANEMEAQRILKKIGATESVIKLKNE